MMEGGLGPSAFLRVFVCFSWQLKCFQEYIFLSCVPFPLRALSGRLESAAEAKLFREG